MKINKLLILGLALSMVLLTNCTKNEEESTTLVNPEVVDAGKFDLGKNVSRAFKGLIVNENNQPISGVTVKMNGKVTTTNANGEFTLSNVTVKERFAYLTAEKAGYLNGSRTLMTHSNLNTTKIMLVQPSINTIQSGVTSNVVIGNTTVTFDGSFITESGQTYNGAVKVLSYDMPANDPNVFDKMPGSLFAIDAQGEYRGLETFGMVTVELKGTNNQKLQLASGHKAQIKMKITENQQNYAKNTIPMWWFDEVAGIWKEEGFSTRVGNDFVGEVSHFTAWNNDYAYVVAQLTVIAVNWDGTPAVGIRNTITRPNGFGDPDPWNEVLIQLGITGANGTLTVGVPRNEPLIFDAYDADGILVHHELLPSSSQLTRTVNVVIPVNNRP